MKGIFESALRRPARRPNPRAPRDFGNSVDHQKSVRPFKGIFCRDISEFESFMPSQAVGSLPTNRMSLKTARHRVPAVAPQLMAHATADRSNHPSRRGLRAVWNKSSAVWNKSSGVVILSHSLALPAPPPFG